MNYTEARAYVDGFTDGGLFFAASPTTHEKRRGVFRRIKSRLRKAQAVSEPHHGNEGGTMQPGSCARCGKFHSASKCRE